MTREVRDKFLEKHNRVRSLVAWGEAVDKKGLFAPQASQMPKLKYNCNIETSAKNHARRCKFKHSEKATSRKLGENLAQLMNPKLTFVQAANMSVEAWFSELKEIGVGKQLNFTSSLARTGVGHYTQLVWQRTTEIGCGIARCPGENSKKKIFVVCQYKRPGNVINRRIYDIGRYCSKCGERRCEKGLCV
ncbi:SCP-like protein [Dictyocaulus viviparus]|uniref:SCP-like protein n=1 Tax=Dictyocaulus viviparus TaxID=29172 RepID=A0A0D8X6G9_DICVI|nr:SCP-like protein [Dictyocaulus viviparus]